MIRLIQQYSYSSIVLISIILFIPLLGQVPLLDWDEANFGELAREMIRTGNYLQPQINFLPFYEKPPMFIWMQVASMKVFGINEFAARFPNAVGGMFTLLSLHYIGNRIEGKPFGFIWVVTYLGSLLPFLYFRTGLIDPWFNLFMFLSVWCGYEYCEAPNKQFSFIIGCVLFLSLAIMTKGPVALILVGLSLGIYGLLFFKRLSFEWKHLLLGILILLVLSGLWFFTNYVHYGSNYIIEFIKYQIRLFSTEDALHGGPIYYHLVVLWIGCFPAVLFAANRIKTLSKIKESSFEILMMICLVVVVVLFSIVKTKIVHYSSMAYFPLCYLAAKQLKDWYKGDSGIPGVLIGYQHVLVIFMLLLCMAIPIVGNHIQWLMPFIQDVITRDVLSMPVGWQEYEIYAGVAAAIAMAVLYSVVWNRRSIKMFAAFAIMPCFILFNMVVLLPKVERYVQGPMIDFARSKKGESCYFLALPIKSYAMFYYADVAPFKNDSTKNLLWLLYGETDRKTYIISKPQKLIELRDTVGLKPLYSNGSFLFLERPAVSLHAPAK